MPFIDKTIQELVAHNHSVAEALHFLGIHFYNYTEHTLEEICKERGLKPEVVIKRIKESFDNQHRSSEIKFQGLPIDLLIEYLKHNHYIFIKQKLPFISALVNNFEGRDPQIKQELKEVFPLFLEDFVEHIYEEEDSFFSYILLLHKALTDNALLNKVQAKMMDNSMRQFYSDHEIHDDQLKGLRRLTNNFEIEDNYDLHTKVVFTELKKLDGELRFHAKVENDILFPRALQLERTVLAMLRSKIALN